MAQRGDCAYSSRTMSRVVLMLVAVTTVAFLPGEAHAKRGYWFAGFAGELLLPDADTEERYRRAIGAELRVGRTGRSGLGIAAIAGYSPLPRADTGGLPSENHFVTLGALPRFTLGSGSVRAWLGAGGGLLLEHITLRPEDGSSLSGTSFDVAAMGEAALELHVFDSAGLSFNAGYRRALGSFETSLLSVGGSLVFTFP